jgi:BirA family biotin operon repressor/biotin-[acetyl-CoA-carboxylase] ligase
MIDTLTACDHLNIEAMRRDLASETFACHIYLFGEVSSTNEVLRRLAGEGAREGTVVIAEAQRAGRGRFGKPWFSPPGVNLYLSVLLRPDVPVKETPVFGQMAALALTEAIWIEGVPATVRWPNDVLIEGRKVAGILLECATRGDLVEHVIVGVGVNLNVTREALAVGLGPEPAGATSLREVAGQEIDRNRFVATFLNLFEKWLALYRTHGPAPVGAAWWERVEPGGAPAD